MSSAIERPRALVPGGSPTKDTRERVRKALLAAGVLSSLLYVVTADVILASLWNIMGGFFPLDLHDDASVPGHIVATNVQLLLMVTAMGCAAAAFHGWIRWYSIASLFTSVVLGAVAFMFAAQAPHPMLGIGER